MKLALSETPMTGFHNETHMLVSSEDAGKTGCTGLSESWLISFAISTKIPCAGSNISILTGFKNPALTSCYTY